MRAKELEQIIRKHGGTMIRQRGSHRRWQLTTEDGTTIYATIPNHPGKDIPPGTLRSIEKQLEPALGKGWAIK